MKKGIFALIILFLLTGGGVPSSAFAHCPLCVAGAGVLAVAAASVGIKTGVVGIFIGAFALALGLWISRMIKREYIKYQKALLTLTIFLGTIIPIMPFIREYQPFYVSLWGEYGTLLHNTYMVNLYLLGSLIGAFLLFISPYISQLLVYIRKGRQLPFQGLGIAFGLLIAASLLFQFIL